MNAEQIASTLARARAGHALASIDENDVPTDLDQAYAIQALAIQKLGQPLGGWKIGATGEAAKAMLRLDEPFFGPMPEIDIHENGAEIVTPPGLRGLEIELAFKLSRPLPRREQPYTLDEVRHAVASLHPAIELVGGRVSYAGDRPGLMAVADFGNHASFVHGPAIRDWDQLDLSTIEAAALIDGEEKARGSAAQVLGSPINALLWVAIEGPGLQAGDWVSTGTLTGLLALPEKAHFVGDFGALGKVEARLA